MFVFAEERERSNGSIHLRMKQASPFHTRSDQAAAHVPLPRITMSKSCFSARIFILAEKQHRPQGKPGRRRGRGV
jgi:hypothetical protein